MNFELYSFDFESLHVHLSMVALHSIARIPSHRFLRSLGSHHIQANGGGKSSKSKAAAPPVEEDDDDEDDD